MFWHAAPSRKFVDLSECPNTRKETSLSRSYLERVDCALKRAFGSDDYAELFRARTGRVEQLELYHHEVARGRGTDDSIIFGALAFVCGYGIGEHEHRPVGSVD